ncbi:MAG: hypothetical protein VCF25_16575 [Candidatus Poribacteria bacterium]
MPQMPMEINAVMLGSEWCLVAMAGEAFTEYELWINALAPFEQTMVFGFTNAVVGPRTTPISATFRQIEHWPWGSKRPWWPRPNVWKPVPFLDFSTVCVWAVCTVVMPSESKARSKRPLHLFGLCLRITKYHN